MSRTSRTSRALLVAAALGAALVSGPPPAAARGAAHAGLDSLRVCVLVGDSLREVPGTTDPATGDTLTVAGRPFAEATLSGRYAEREDWYVQRLPLTLQEHWTVKFGGLRVVPPELLAFAGHHEGVPLFVATGAYVTVPPIFYVPVRPGCVFQPYAVPVH